MQWVVFNVHYKNIGLTPAKGDVTTMMIYYEEGLTPKKVGILTMNGSRRTLPAREVTNVEITCKITGLVSGASA